MRKSGETGAKGRAMLLSKMGMLTLERDRYDRRRAGHENGHVGSTDKEIMK